MNAESEVNVALDGVAVDHPVHPEPIGEWLHARACHRNSNSKRHERYYRRPQGSPPPLDSMNQEVVDLRPQRV